MTYICVKILELWLMILLIIKFVLQDEEFYHRLIFVKYPFFELIQLFQYHMFFDCSQIGHLFNLDL
jgi:hypothetical protein